MSHQQNEDAALVKLAEVYSLASKQLDDFMNGERFFREREGALNAELDDCKFERDRYKEMIHESIGEIGSALVVAHEALRQIADMPKDSCFAEAPAACAKDAVNIARVALGWEEITSWP